MIPHRTLIGFSLAIMVSVGTLFAQVGRATISGTVRDASGAVVPHAPVAITNTGTGVAFKTTTTSSGEYVAPNLIPGNYSVSVAALGFVTIVCTGKNQGLEMRDASGQTS